MSDLSISVQPRGQGYVRLGKNHRLNVVPDSIRFSGNVDEYGCFGASWLMKMNPKLPHYDIEHYTPFVIEDGGDPVFSGRIITTPTSLGDEGVYHVEAQGWGQSIKDKATDKIWVVSDLSKWKNSAAHPSTSQASVQPNNNIVIGDGNIILGCGNNVTWQQNRLSGATLDLGINNLCTKAIGVFVMPLSVGSASFTVYLRISDSPDPFNTGVGTSSVNNPPAAFNTITTTATTGADPGGRYIHAFWYWNGVQTTTPNDHTIKFTSIIAFTSNSYESLGASILKASTIISEALDTCVNISTDRSLITATSLSFPNFPSTLGGRKYPNEIIDAANAPHGYLLTLSADPVPVPTYAPLPTDYTYVVGAGEYKLEDPSKNEGRAVYNEIIAEYEDVNGVRGEGSASVAQVATPFQYPNPTFAVNTTGWGVPSGTLTRDAAVFDDAAGSGRMTTNGTGVAEVSIIGAAGSLSQNTLYTLRIRYRRILTLTNAQCIVTDNGNTCNVGSPIIKDKLNHIAVGAFANVDIPFRTGSQADASFTFRNEGAVASDICYIDNIQILSQSGDVVSQRGITRTALKPMSGKSTQAIADAMSTLELNAALQTPFKGKIRVDGRIRLKGGGTTPVNRIPSNVGKALLIEDLEDEVTGVLGRQGIIMFAEYFEKDNYTEIQIDDPSNFITGIRSRIAM